MASSKRARKLSCKQAAQRSTEFLEGRLGAASRVRFVQHLETCAACCTYARQIALVRDSLHKLPAAEMPASVRRKLLKRLAERTTPG